MARMHQVDQVTEDFSTSKISDFNDLIDLSSAMPLQHRKALLDVYQRGYIPKKFWDEFPRGWVGYNRKGDEITLLGMKERITTVLSSTLDRSLALHLCRVQPIPAEEGKRIITETIGKEYLAASQRFEGLERIDYSALTGEWSNCWTQFRPITPNWTRHAARFVHNFMEKMRGKTLYPTVQRSKNMSVESCRRLAESGYVGDRRWRDFRTVDLEVHYYQTGEKIGGDSEMRCAWRYNDLKPRAYYCLGGGAYWASSYAKHMAVAMMEAGNYTQLWKRKDPTQLTHFVSEENFTLVWDYSSFTSTLSELRRFLRCVVEEIRERGDVELEVFDYSRGFVKISLADYLENYNEEVNTMDVAIYRVLEHLEFSKADPYEKFPMANSGGLGVPGNIGFSTSLHGLHIHAGVGEGDKGVSVGDDAFAQTPDNPMENGFIQHLQCLGVVHPEKTEMMYPNGEFRRSKFLKRGFHQYGAEITLDFVLQFPVLAYAYGLQDPFRVPSHRTKGEEVQAVVTGIASLLRAINKNSQLFSDYDIERLGEILRRVYWRLGLPKEGCISGHVKTVVDVPNMKKIWGLTEMMYTFDVPPVPGIGDFDPRDSDWSDVLWATTDDSMHWLPIDNVVDRPLPRYEPEGVFATTSHPLLAYLVDIGCLLPGKLCREWVPHDLVGYNVYKNSLMMSKPLYTYTWSKRPPKHYVDFLDSYDANVSGPELMVAQNHVGAILRCI